MVWSLMSSDRRLCSSAKWFRTIGRLDTRVAWSLNNFDAMISCFLKDMIVFLLRLFLFLPKLPKRDRFSPPIAIGGLLIQTDSEIYT